MKEDILLLLRKNPQQHFNTRQIAHHLEIQSAQFKKLRHDLKELVSEGKVVLHPDERYSNRDRNKIIKGVIKVKSEGYGFLIPETKGKSDVFVPARHMNFAMNGDTVLAESFRSKEDGRYEGRVIQIVKRANPVVVGQVEKKDKHFFVRTMDAGAALEIYIPQKNLDKAVVGNWVAVKMIQYPGVGVMALGEVCQIISDSEGNENFAEAVLMKHGIKREFLGATHHEVAQMPDEVEDPKDAKRLDLSALPIVTIDGITARDFDDAVCVVQRGQATVLYVSIADVSEYVRPGMKLDQDAYDRSTSTYLSDECVPMLPEKLSNGLCSLNPFKPRLTLTAEIHYNREAEFISARFYRSLIRSRKRCTYEEVQAFFDSSENTSLEPDIQKSLLLMRELAEKLIVKSKQRGTFGFDLPEAEVVYDVHGKIKTIQKAARFFSHKLIEMMMVAANVAVAEYFTANGLPLVFRVHDQPDPVKLQNFIQMVTNMGLGHKLKGFHPAAFFEDMKGHKLESFLQSVFLRSLKQAVYDAENIGHYGLMLEDYCHFTSPIRRYPDLIVHRQLKTMLEQTTDGVLHLKAGDLKRKPRKLNQRTLYSFQDLKVIGQHCSKRERDAMEAEREIAGIRKAQFIRDFVHEKFFGRISRISRYGVLIELEPYFVEGFLPIAQFGDDYYIYDEKRIRFTGRRTHKVLQIGDRVWVSVADVKPENAEVNLIIAGQSGTSPTTQKKNKKKKRHGHR